MPLSQSNTNAIQYYDTGRAPSNHLDPDTGYEPEISQSFGVRLFRFDSHDDGDFADGQLREAAMVRPRMRVGRVSFGHQTQRVRVRGYHSK